MSPSPSLPQGLYEAGGGYGPSMGSEPMRRAGSGPGSSSHHQQAGYNAHAPSFHRHRNDSSSQLGNNDDLFSRPPRPSYAENDFSSSYSSSPTGSASFQQQQQQQTASVASPTKRGFFSGMRDRKASITSLVSGHAGSSGSGGRTGGAGAGGRGAFIGSPLTRDTSYAQQQHMLQQPPVSPTEGLSSSPSYATFSRSQGDLHAPSRLNHDVPSLPVPTGGTSMEFSVSPNSGLISLPSQGSASTEGTKVSNSGSAKGGFLQSPSPNYAYSRSVEDLGGNGASSPSAMDGAVSMSPPAVPASAMQRQPSPSSRHARSASGSGGTIGQGAAQRHAMPHVPALHSGSQGQQRQANHTRKGSRLPFGLAGKVGNVGAASADKDSHSGSQGRASSLASSLGIGSSAVDAGKHRAASPSPQSSSVSLPLGPGVTYQGLLNRNANISLSYSQLCEGREKDISKGWKPYKVILQDGSLQFFKPPSALADEVRSHFPATLVRPPPKTGAGSSSSNGGGSGSLADQYAGSAPLDAEALKRSGLGTKDLLSATSSSSVASTSPNSQADARMESAGSSSVPTMRLPRPVLSRLVTAETTYEDATWHRPGHHEGLTLVDSQQDPGSWAQRIHAGTIAALAHELVHGTQRSIAKPTDASVAENIDSDATELIQAILASLLGSSGALPLFVTEVRNVVGSKDQVSEGAKSIVTELLTSLQPEMALRDDRKSTAAAIRVLHAEIGSAAPAWCETLEENSKPEAKAPAVPSKRSQLRSLAGGLLPSDVLVRIPPQEIASQIQAWHVQKLSSHLEPFVDMGAILAQGTTAQRLLAFDKRALHPITHLVLDQILDLPTASSESQQTKPTPSKSPRERAAVLRHWIAVASYLQAFGDLPGWLAVAAGLCSRAVARLEATWRFVAAGDKELVSSIWAPLLFDIGWTESVLSHEVREVLKTADGASPQDQQGEMIRGIPYLGNLHIPALGKSADVAFPVEARISEGVRLAKLAQSLHASQSTARVEFRAVEPLLQEYESLLDTYVNRSATTLDDYVKRSLVLEPAHSSNAGESLWERRAARQAGTHATAPLAFAHPLPLCQIADSESAKRPETSGSFAGRTAGDANATLRRVQPTASAVSRIRAMPFATASRRDPLTRIFKRESEASVAPIMIGNELVLQPIGESIGSLSSSPRGSKRFSQDFGRSSRPTSHASKRSSLPASNRASVGDVGMILHVELKAATLDRLSEFSSRSDGSGAFAYHCPTCSRRDGDGRASHRHGGCVQGFGYGDDTEDAALA